MAATAEQLREMVERLVRASFEFTDGEVVDETAGTIPLMAGLAATIAEACEMIGISNPCKERS